MQKEDILSVGEAMLLYTQIKMEMANRFREGISYEDFVDYEKKLALIDKSFETASLKLAEKIDTEIEKDVKNERKGA